MRTYNFSAGPAALPTSVMQDVQAELLDWEGLGVSVMEIGHRHSAFQTLMQEAEANLRSLLKIPKDYYVLFLGGAARTQFAMIPMNLLGRNEEGAYLISGLWSSLAFQEASKFKQAYVLASSEDTGFRELPELNETVLRPNTRYFYYTPNETVNGVQFSNLPQTSVPIVADMTSCLLSEPINVSDYGLIFAGAQKNIAPAGLTIVIIDSKLLQQEVSELPTMFNYKTFAETHSSYATPPTFNIYMANKMFHWIKTQGGIERLYELNCKKAALLYSYIDASPFYDCDIEKNARSIMNVCFRLNNSALEKVFVNKATKSGLFGLGGHRLVGGIRASLYNAMPLSGVDALIDFMTCFAKEYA